MSAPRGPRTGGVSEILCAKPGFPSRFDEAFVEHDGELSFRFAPFTRRPIRRSISVVITSRPRRLIGAGVKAPPRPLGRGAEG